MNSERLAGMSLFALCKSVLSANHNPLEFMIQAIKSFLAYVRFSLFTTRIEREIYHGIFPHLEQEKDCGYPFASDKEFLRQLESGNRELEAAITALRRRTDAMPRAYGQAFRYIVCRDLNQRLKLYAELAKWRAQPKSADPRLVARQA